MRRPFSCLNQAASPSSFWRSRRPPRQANTVETQLWNILRNRASRSTRDDTREPSRQFLRGQQRKAPAQRTEGLAPWRALIHPALEGGCDWRIRRALRISDQHRICGADSELARTPVVRRQNAGRSDLGTSIGRRSIEPVSVLSRLGK